MSLIDSQLRKIACLSIALLLVFSQNAFSGEQINLPAQENLTRLSPPQKSDVVQSGPDWSNLIGFGPDKSWRIYPGFEFKSIFDSNINREPQRQREADVILDYAPSVKLKRRGAHLSVESGYRLDFFEFINYPKNNHFNHEATTKVKFIGKRLNTTIDEKFLYAKDYATDEQSKRRTYVVNEVRPEMAYRLTPKFSIASVYRNYLVGYKDRDFREYSYDMNDMGGRIYYHMTPKLDTYVQGTGTVTNYFESKRFDSHGFTGYVGATGRVTSKLLLDLQTGYKGHSYDDVNINSFQGWVFDAYVQYKLRPRILVALIGKRDKQESTYGNVGWFQAHKFGAELNYKISKHFVGKLSQTFQRNAYSKETREGRLTKKRVDYIYNTGVNIKWLPIQHLIIALGYAFRYRDGNFDNLFDYIDHVADSSIAYEF